MPATPIQPLATSTDDVRSFVLVGYIGATNPIANEDTETDINESLPSAEILQLSIMQRAPMPS